MSNFSIRNLIVAAYAGGFSLWSYKDMTAKIDDVLEQSFFNGGTDLISRGDMILVSAFDGGAQIYITEATEHRIVFRVMSETN